MRRRLEIARGLMHSPRVLFLDEPTIGLDPQTRRSIWSYIRELKEREEITIFMTTHYMDEAEWCDRIAIMDHGQIVALDAPETLKAQIGNDRVTIHTDDDQAAIAALAERFGIEARDRRGRGHFGVPAARSSCRGCSPSSAIPIRAVSVSRPTLDDVFMSYTGTTIRDAEEDQSKHRNRVMMQMMTEVDDEQPPRVDRTEPSRAPSARRREHEPRSSGSASPSAAWRSELRAIKIVWRRELIRFRADRLRMITSLVQPLLFLFVLGAGLQGLARAGTHGVALKTFIYPGILCISVMFTAMFSAASIVWDREFGFLREMMVAPIRRSSIVIGKCLGGATVAGFQGVIVICLAGLVQRPLQPAADPRDLRPAAAAGVLDHRLRGDDRRAHQADAVVHGRHADDRDADVLHLRRAVPGRRAAALAGRAQPSGPADLRGRPDAPHGVRRPDAPGRRPSTRSTRV